MSHPRPQTWEVEGLSYAVEGKEILRDLAFGVEEGEFLSVIGPNGAGKTTLLRHLNRGLLSRRKIRFRARWLDQWRVPELARYLSYVPQMKGGVPPYDVTSFLLMSRHPHISPWRGPLRSDREIVDAVVRRAGLGDLAGRQLDTLSGGERQVAYIAAAMAQQTPAVLLDEPTVYLDPGHEAGVAALLGDLNRRDGKTVVMVTHDANLAMALSDRVLGLKDGRLHFLKRVPDLTRQDLEALFAVEFATFVESPGGSSTVYLPVPRHPGGGHPPAGPDRGAAAGGEGGRPRA
ncbi:MAG: ABC transporter ATP-binding protein [Acidobacteria bacterium]|nr:ABC transporter ATP-binding protein [Acidobacteriota bacterium]